MLIITRTTKVNMEPRNYCGCCIHKQESKCPELSGLPDCSAHKCKKKLPLPKEKVCLPILCQNCWPCQHNQPGQWSAMCLLCPLLVRLPTRNLKKSGIILQICNKNISWKVWGHPLFDISQRHLHACTHGAWGPGPELTWPPPFWRFMGSQSQQTHTPPLQPPHPPHPPDS